MFTSHYTVPSSSASVSQALLSSLPKSNIHLSSYITSIHRSFTHQTSSITFIDTLAGQEHTLDGFSDVVFATQANQAKRLVESLLEDVKGEEKEEVEVERLREVAELLGQFKYVVRSGLSFFFLLFEVGR